MLGKPVYADFCVVPLKKLTKILTSLSEMVKAAAIPILLLNNMQGIDICLA
jgi:hypothetical protein